MTSRSESLFAWASARGYQVAWGPSRVLAIVQQDLEARIARGELDPAFVRDALPRFAFDVPAGWTVLAVALPAPAHVVSVSLKGRSFDVIVPPTYVSYRPVVERIRRDLLSTALAGCETRALEVPYKPLAARLGLVRYGRNNITYAPVLGSYCQLAAYATDAALPIPQDWQADDLRLLDDCEDCGVCEAVCPTGAIRDDRILLHAERCVTFATESFAPLPSWLPPLGTLIGCLECQRTCPANPPLPIKRTVALTEEETSALVAGSGASDEVWEAIRDKLATLELSEPALVGRNLRALLERKQ